MDVITGLGKRNFGEMEGEKCPTGGRRIKFKESKQLFQDAVLWWTEAWEEIRVREGLCLYLQMGGEIPGLCAHGDDSVDKDSLMTGRGRGIFGAISMPRRRREGGHLVWEWRGGSREKKGIHLLPRESR